MNIWVLNAIIIETMTAVGIVGVSLTGRTGPAFLAGFNTMILVTGAYVLTAPPPSPRQMTVLAMVALYLVHMDWLLLFHRGRTAVAKLDRDLPPLQKFVLPFALTNVAGWVYCLPFYFAARRVGPLGPLDLGAIGVYLLGTVIHFGSDYQKQRFKREPGARGRLLDRGFWALCRHPNYFGDFLIYISFGLIGGSPWGWAAPLVNLLQYLLDAIPRNERWAAQRYGAAWEAYAKRTKRFIPFLY